MQAAELRRGAVLDLDAVPLAQRRDRLAAVRDLLASDPTPVLELLTEVSTYRAAGYELQAAIDTLDGAVAEVAASRPPPVAAMAVFLPSNVLLYSYVLYALVPSLFTERIRLRPSSQVSGQAIRLHQLLAPVHGLPVDLEPVSQRAFMRDSVAPADVVVFTGTYQNAEQLRPQLSASQLFLYLGAGVNPFVVAPGADLSLAVRDAVEIRLLNSGQDCLAPDLLVVNDGDLDDFVDGLVRELKGVRYGPYTDPQADYGPIFYEGALEAAALYLFRHHRHIVHGGNVDFRSRRVDPAVLVRPFDEKPPVTEFFAPIFNVVGYRDEAAAARALTTGAFAERALGASVYGDAPALVEALARRHTVTVNRSLLAIDDGNAPFGGYGPMANYVSHGGRLRAEPILVSKAVADHLRTGSAPASAPVAR